MFAGPSGTRKTNATATLNKEKRVPQNSTLENHHGISMKNPEEITGNTRDLFLKMLSKLAQFLDFAETGLANFNKNTKQTGLEIKNDERLTESKSQKPKLPVTLDTALQARLGVITQVPVTASPPPSENKVKFSGTNFR